MSTADGSSTGGSGTLVFLHLPKTGGITVRRVLTRCFPPNEILHVYGPQTDERPYGRLHEMTSEQRSALRLVHGHIPFGVHEDLPGPVTYFTMMREPTRVAVSAYHYMRKRWSESAHHRVGRRDVTFEEFLEEGLAEMAGNNQTRLLAGLTRPLAARYDEDIVTKAKANLDAIDVVGLTERFDASMLMLSQRFGLPTPYYYRRNQSSASRGAPPVPEESLARIREGTRMDAEVYAHAKARFERDAQSFEGALERRAAWFRLRNKSYGKLYALFQDVKDYGQRALKEI